jgi:hypothetical protein
MLGGTSTPFLAAAAYEAVASLIDLLYSRRIPKVEDDDVARPLHIETGAAGLNRDEEDGRPDVTVE